MKAQLTIRDLFWLVLVCALAVGWWMDHQRLESLLKFTLRKLDILSGKEPLTFDSGFICTDGPEGTPYVFDVEKWRQLEKH
jgi:hypothetical protein